MGDSEPTHFQFAPQCLFCGKNSKSRNSRKGRYWRCRKCGEMNPGPGMIKAMVGRFTSPPASARRGNGHAVTPAAQQQPATAAVTTIKAAPAAIAAKPSPPAKPAPKPFAVPAAALPTEKKAGFLERVIYGE